MDKKYVTFEDMFEVMHYPAGEPHLELKGRNTWGDKLVIFCNNVRDFNDLMLLKVGKMILDDYGWTQEWVIPYFPFARHDRRNHNGDGFELIHALGLMGDLNPVIFDPHSDVAGVLRHVPQSEIVKHFASSGLFHDDPIIAIPDAGATKKTMSWIGQMDYVQCLKTRDTATGQLSGFRVIDPEKVWGRHVVIVDDICDGGGTFLGLASELEKAGAESLRLAVTHGLFTKSIVPLELRFLGGIWTLDTTHERGHNLRTVSTEQIYRSATTV